MAVLLTVCEIFASIELPNVRNLAKFPENSKLWQVKVIQSHRSWCQSKAPMRHPITR